MYNCQDKSVGRTVYHVTLSYTILEKKSIYFSELFQLVRNERVYFRLSYFTFARGTDNGIFVSVEVGASRNIFHSKVITQQRNITPATLGLLRFFYRHSLVDCGSSQLYLSVCVCVCVSVCPAFTAYISVTMGRILIKLGGNVGT